MKIKQNISLASYSTMGLGGKTEYLASIGAKEDLIEALSFAREHRLRTLMIGGGSNIIWRDEGFKGLVLLNNIRGFEVENENNDGADIIIGAGEKWDSVVDRAVSLGLSGIECLSLIPGSAGATPVQNVGAYGQEISESLVSLVAYDKKAGSFLTMVNEDCDFSYRNSCFKQEQGRYFILSIRLHLKKSPIKMPIYKSLDKYLADNNITDTSPKTIRQAVIDIRQAKLPDPNVIKNCGSFFKNPIITNDQFAKLISKYPDIPHWQMKDGQIKLSAAWLVENTGFKNYKDSETGMAIWNKQPLILINENAKSTSDLLKFKDRIVESVRFKFQVELIQEPELLP